MGEDNGRKCIEGVIERYEKLRKKIFKSKEDELHLEMTLFALEAVKMGSEFGIVLDFTVSSISKVEEFLGQIEGAAREANFDDEEVGRFSYILGGYIGEVLIQSGKNIKWIQGNENVVLLWTLKNGRGEFELEILRKVFKRIRNGEEDNVVFFLESTFYMDNETLGLMKLECNE